MTAQLEAAIDAVHLGKALVGQVGGGVLGHRLVHAERGPEDAGADVGQSE